MEPEVKATDLIVKVDNQLSNVRAMQRLVLSQSFPIAYLYATKEQKMRFEDCVKGLNYVELKRIIGEILKNGNMSIRELRTIAARLQISHWSRMSKDELLAAISIKEHHGT